MHLAPFNPNQRYPIEVNQVQLDSNIFISIMEVIDSIYLFCRFHVTLKALIIILPI